MKQAALAILLLATLQDKDHRSFEIRVVDEKSGDPVPGVTLETVHHVTFQTDSRGIAAVYEPGLMGSQVWFHIAKPGYEYPHKAFSWRGAKIKIIEGGSTVLKIRRVQEIPDKRKYRERKEVRQRFAIRVVDDRSGRGVPLVELKLPGWRSFTDSNGYIAFGEPEFMGKKLAFSVFSHGYQDAKVTFKVDPGGEGTFRIKRKNIAERLYRVTGGGIYRDSVLLGKPTPLKNPNLAGRVLGQDSVLTVIYKDRVFWLWGDTNRPSFPLGNFHTSCARSDLPKNGGLDPEKGVDLEYFVGRDGFSKEMARMPGPHGTTWLGGLVTIEGRLFADYGRFTGLKYLTGGLCEFDDRKKQFVEIRKYTKEDILRPFGHPMKWGKHIYYGSPFPFVRAPADPDKFADLKSYEAYTGSSWKKGVQPLKKPKLRDIETGRKIEVHGGSVNWNPYRKRFVAIILESWGEPSFLGEIWYAEADAPEGPWVYARRVVTHRNYSFYNPKHHVFFDKDGGRVIFFEGTYTTTFSGSKDPTPRYNYNQIMYKLELDDPRLALPLPVYDRAGQVAFFAPDRKREGTVPVYAGNEGGWSLTGEGDPLFYALPADTKSPPPDTKLLRGLGRVWKP